MNSKLSRAELLQRTMFSAHNQHQNDISKISPPTLPHSQILNTTEFSTQIIYPFLSLPHQHSFHSSSYFSQHKFLTTWSWTADMLTTHLSLQSHLANTNTLASSFLFLLFPSTNLMSS